MYKVPAILFVLILAITAAAQKTIKGRVADEATGLPVANANVFINKTSKGTITSAEGFFKLSDIPDGKYELIISCIGFQTQVIAFNEDSLPMELKIDLHIKVKELENVTVETFVEGDWKRWGKAFTENFIGTTDNAARCKIVNKEAIRFKYYKESDRLSASADVPLLIENNALGYTIIFQLEEFEVNFKQQSLLFAGYELVEDMSKNDEVPEKWKRKRLEAYQGSLMHFMRSLYNNQLEQEGFNVKRIYKLPNTEKVRVKKIINTYSLSKKNLPKDSMNYYSLVLKQDDSLTTYGEHLLTSDSLLKASNKSGKLLSFNDYLFVTYKGGENYITISNFSIKQISERSAMIEMQKGATITIYVNGSYYNQRDLILSDYLSESRKIANHLPLDYTAQKK
jgi:CarboxypepD_reg-like domain